MPNLFTLPDPLTFSLSLVPKSNNRYDFETRKFRFALN